MLARKLASFSHLLIRSSSTTAPSTLLRHPQSPFFFSSTASEEAASCSSDKKGSLGRTIFRVALISVAGGFALSALNDLAIFHGCSSEAIEKASQNQKIIETLGVPIVRGPWYDASLAVGHRRQSVSCTFPVSGPQGSGIFQLKAIRRGGYTYLTCCKFTLASCLCIAWLIIYRFYATFWQAFSKFSFYTFICGFAYALQLSPEDLTTSLCSHITCRL